MRRWVSSGLACALLFLVPGFATAQGWLEDEESAVSPPRLIGVESPGPAPERGRWTFSLDGRFFGGVEDRVFGSGELLLGCSESMELGLRGSRARCGRLVGPEFTICHGGTDVEAFVRYRPAEYAGMALHLGIAFPDTPAQQGAFVTLAGLAERALGSHVRLVFHPRVVFVGRPIVGIGAGVAVKLSDRVEVMGDGTMVINGWNTYSVATGRKRAQPLWSGGIRVSLPGGGHNTWLTAGVTNALGATTGLGLSPGLGGSASVFVGLTVRR
ncbi:MAG TPA: hypothetical protein VLH79_02085 [Chthonomonadales bacterium]|nr:hypothetical protein [Chthonomonadales bacterium]